MICALCLLLAKAPITRDFSVYHSRYAGRTMASGHRYDPNKLTVASNDFKLGTRLELCHGKYRVTVTVTDRMAKTWTGKRVDLSTAAWRKLGGGKPGILRGGRVEEKTI